MHVSRRSAVAAVALGSAAVTALGLVTAGAADASPGRVPTVVAHMSNKSISLSTGHVMRPGRVVFKVVSRNGGHFLQLARLRHGYSLQQAGKDINKAFRGDVAAVRRVDHGVGFRGGARARPQHPGRFSVSLGAGHYVLLDQNGPAADFLTVKGKARPHRTIQHSGTITAFSYGFGNHPQVLPRAGWMRMNNRSDQPHFVEVHRVKSGTTGAMVHHFIKSGTQGKPKFLLRRNTQSGIISPYRGELLRYNLPAGKYLVACFWPDDDTGMPHFFMGMWKLIRLR